MPAVSILFSLSGLVFLGIRLAEDPAGRLAYFLGAVACLFVCARSVTVIRSSRRIASTGFLREVRHPETLNEALGSERAILYKHSTSCPTSAVVLDEVLQFAGRHPEWRIYVLEVIERRDLSDAVARRLSVPHESPQAFIIRQGRCVWHTSHYDITAKRLSQQAV